MNDVYPGARPTRRDLPNSPLSASVAMTERAAEAAASGVSWGAVVAGAVSAAALALILSVLGVGLGLSTLAPWAAARTAAGAIGASAILWLIASQAIASGLGGYLSGRLRVKWSGVHDDEVYFRDTAHGFLAWALGTVITAAFLVSALASVAGGAGSLTASALVARGVPSAAGNRAGASSAQGQGAAQVAATEPALPSTTGERKLIATGTGANASGAAFDGNAYVIDVLLRPTPGSSPAVNPDAAPGGLRAEIARVLEHAVRVGALSDADRTYLAQQVAMRTGADTNEAGTRVDNAFGQMRALVQEIDAFAQSTANDARSGAAKASLWIFVALLAGAFCASLAATLGGRQREADQAAAL